MTSKIRKNRMAISDFDNVGRNDPCPCDSGKKFKKCCMQKKVRGFTAKVIKGGTGLGLGSLMKEAAQTIKKDEKAFEEKQAEKEKESSSSTGSKDA